MEFIVANSDYEAELGHFHVSAWSPTVGTVLDGVVERIWYFDGTMSYRRERAFPNGLIEIIVQLDEPHRPVATDLGAPFPAVCVAGLQRQSTVVEAPASRCRVLGIRLHPTAASTVLRWAPNELLDRTVDLRDVLGRSAAELGERCFAARDGAACVRIAVDWIAARMRESAPVDSRIAYAITRLRAATPQSIAAVMAEVNLSSSQFIQLFRAGIGVSPKRYARIARFKCTIDAINACESIADIAAHAGYFDQSHLSAEFREHSGFTVTEYRRALRYEGGSLAEPPATASIS